MASTVEQADIRGLDIDKAVKGFAEVEYVFKNDLMVTSTKADSIRWYQKTAGDLTPTAPSVISNVSPLSIPTTLEVSWSRNTSYVRKYMVEGFLSMEDIESADIDVLAQTLRDLTRAITKAVDQRIYSVVCDYANVNMFTITSGAWNIASFATEPIKDILFAKEHLTSGGYNAEGTTLWLHPQGYRALINYLIAGKGSSIPNYASEKIKTGVVMSLLNVNIKVSPNCSADQAVLLIPQRSATWKSFTDTTARTIEEPGLGKKIRVWEIGEAILTDPKSVVVISNILA